MLLLKRFLPGLLAFWCLPLMAAPKTDIVILENGDRITGEIKRLEAGLLEFSTDTMGTVTIEWRFIAQVISDTSQVVETTEGQRWLGQLEKPPEGENIVVNTVRGPVTVQSEQAVAVWPVKATFWDKMELDTSVGFDYAKSTDITDFSLAVDFLHRGNERLTDFTLRSDITRQSQGEEQQRSEFRFSHQYLLPKLRSRNWFAGLESNEALGVDLRLYGGYAVGKYLIKNNNTWFTLAAGLLATQENPESANSATNLEAVGNARYRYFHFADPERTLDANLSVYPSLSDTGRYRVDFRTTFKLEFWRDLFWAMELYANYDNEPLSATAETSDYGVTTSVGWSH